MTVQELQGKLQGLPPDTLIFVEYDSIMEPLNDTLIVDNSLCLFHDGYGSSPHYKEWLSAVQYAKEILGKEVTEL